MRAVRSRTAILATALLALVLPSLASPEATVALKATLTARYLGVSPTGFGTARITFTGLRVCWQFTYKGIGTPTVSGIHKAPPPAGGRHRTAIIPFTATTTTKRDCLTAKAGAVKLVLASPETYYVLVGTAKYQNGAIGGLLHPA
jgi:hypothetical protein